MLRILLPLFLSTQAVFCLPSPFDATTYDCDEVGVWVRECVTDAKAVATKGMLNAKRPEEYQVKLDFSACRYFS